jgi:hypothetical protein
MLSSNGSEILLIYYSSLLNMFSVFPSVVAFREFF